MAYPEEIRNAARGLYLKRWTPQEIKDELGLNSCRIIYYWAEKLRLARPADRRSGRGCHRPPGARRCSGERRKPAAELDELDRLIGHHVSLKEKAIKWAERQQALARPGAKHGDEPASAENASAW